MNSQVEERGDDFCEDEQQALENNLEHEQSGHDLNEMCEEVDECDNANNDANIDNSVPLELTREERDIMQTNRIVALHGKLHKVDESYAFASTILNSIRNQQIDSVDDSFSVNEQLVELEGHEKEMFSETPEYLKDAIEKLQHEITETNKSNTNAPQADKVKQSTYNCNHKKEFFKPSRAYVNPKEPLALPFDAEKYIASTAKENGNVGAYHELFFGDASTFHFDPPLNNPRKRVEKLLKLRPHRQKSMSPSYEPEAKPSRFIVAPDFVPACALRYDQYWRRRQYDKEVKNTSTAPM